MKIGQYTLLSGFLLILFTLGIWSYVDVDNEKSFYENRLLTQTPSFSWEKWESATLSEEWDNYFSDQFIGRQKWIYLYSAWQHALPGVYSKNHYITDKQFIMDKQPTPLSDEILHDSTDKMIRFRDALEKEGIPLYVGLTPSKVNHLMHLYPSYVAQGDGIENRERFVSLLDKKNVNQMDLHTTFMDNYTDKERESLYFKTDHHWNMEGAFVGYQDIMKNLSNDFDNLGDIYTKETVDTFCASNKTLEGSLNKQVSMMVDATGEFPCIYTPKTFDFQTMDIYLGEEGEEGKKVNAFSIYGMDMHKPAPTIIYARAYTYDYPVVNVVNEQAENDYHMLILKDSYVNPITLHLASHFKRTTIIDVRHLVNKTAYEVATEFDVDATLILYNDSFLNGPLYRFGPEK